MDPLNNEFLKVIEAFNLNGVKYLLVGGLAVNHYGYNRSTGDVDFWLKDNEKNRKHLVKAFEDLNYGSFNELMTTPFLPGFCEIYLDSGLYADLLAEIHGFNQSSFDECLKSANISKISNIDIPFISYTHLISSKSASDRDKDKQDVIELNKIKKQ